jgi:hypothetical protein
VLGPEVLLGDRERTQDQTLGFVESTVDGRKIGERGRRRQQGAGARGVLEQALDLGADSGVGATLGEKARPRSFGELERFLEDAVEVGESVVHGWASAGPRSSSERSQARTRSQSRCAVRNQTPSASAVSSSEEPAK